MLALALAMVIGVCMFTACGQSDEKDDSTKATDSSTDATVELTEAETTAPEADVETTAPEAEDDMQPITNSEFISHGNHGNSPENENPETTYIDFEDTVLENDDSEEENDFTESTDYAEIDNREKTEG